MAFSIDDPLGSLGLSGSAIKAGAYDIAYYIIWGVCLLAIAAFAWTTYRNKKIYIYPVRIFRRRSNGLIKEINTFGGYIVKQGVTIFTIKMGKFKKKELPRLPDSSLMDEEDRVYYYQLSPDAPLVQCKRTFNIEQVLVANEKYVEPSIQEKDILINKYINDFRLDENFKEYTEEDLKIIASKKLEDEIEDNKNTLIDVTNACYTPVPTDQKLQAQADIKRFSQVLGVDVNKQFAYFIIGVVAIIIIGAIIFYIAVNKGDVPILTK